MVLRPLFASILAVALAYAGPGWAQGKPKKPIPAIGFDAGPAEGEGPDPLAPNEGPKKVLTAPGAPIKSAEQKPAPEGTVEAWGRSDSNPRGGWYGLKKGLRGRFGVYMPPLLEALGLAEVTHDAKNNRMRAI
jgi:hypothetical protein